MAESTRSAAAARAVSTVLPEDTAISLKSVSSLDTAFPVASADLDHLRDRLATGADSDIDIAYRLIDSPVGTLMLAATRRGLVRVGFEREGFGAVLEQLAAAISPRILCAPARLDGAAAQFDEYFAGRRHTFDLPLDLALSHGFRREVQQYLPRIGYGHTKTYTEIATALGRPRAARAVGSGCSHNPLSIVLPCHRVLRTDGSLGGYLGGLPVKTALLALERAAA